METCRVHREILYAAQDGKCASCGGKMGKLIQASLDHVIPISIGGVDALGNLVLMHGICNAEKSNDIPTGCEMVCLLAVNAKVGALPVEY
jgi:5-methylcytosine-specific restriction endonuclease McrA